MNKFSIHINNARTKGIYREAYLLDQQGWLVLANYIPGFCTPPEIEGFIPDIYAIKELQTYILMIEIREDYNPIRTSLLKAYADEYNNTRFVTFVVDSAGCRIRVY